MSKIYISMPVINCLQMTKDAYESIKSKHNWGFILVDQNSNDDTEEWGREQEKAHGNSILSKFIYIKNSPRVALSAAWNQAIKKAFEDHECEYVGLFNNDIILNPKTVDNLIEFMDKSRYLLVTADNIADRMSIETMKSMELPKPYTDYDLQKIEGWRAEGPDFSCFMINRDFIKIVGWFDENFVGAYKEDQDAHIRINRAFQHISKHNDKGIEADRVHAKRLSTAPYFHFASQTMIKNPELRPDIIHKHGMNENYYLQKWGADHEKAMDGGGFETPFGDARRDWKWWEGVEKYEH